MIEGLKRHFFSRLGRTQAIVRDLRHLPVRRAAERAIASLPDQGDPVVAGPVLVDVAFQHPNFWLRYGLLSAAFGLGKLRRIALYGRFSRPALKGTLLKLGISERLPALAPAARVESFRANARRLISEAGDADGLFRARLPFDMPAFDLYDGLLRTQRNAIVDLAHSNCETYVAGWLAAVHDADELVRSLKPGFAVLSQAQSSNDFYGALAYALLRHGVPFVLPNGFFENLNFTYVRKLPDLYRFFDAAEPEDLAALTPDRANKLEQLGRSALARRFAGESADFVGNLAFGKAKDTWSRERICSEFNWDPAKPIIALLASTWYDFPHLFGNVRFRDLVDWVSETLSKAAKAEGMNFVVRGHPLDLWYNNLFIDEVVKNLGAPNIGVLPYGVDGTSIMRSAQGLLTYYGSAALEYAMSGKPVLVPDVGWYHRHDFVKFTASREEYLDLVGKEWWRDHDPRSAMRSATIVQAMRLGYPAWQGAWRIDDDNELPREEIYARIPRKISENSDAVLRELWVLRRWADSGDRLYHRFKMNDTDSFQHI